MLFWLSLRSLSLLVLASLGAACATSGEARRADPLPFRVLLMPVEVRSVAVASASEADPDVKLTLLDQDVRSALARGIEAGGFVRVDMPPSPTPRSEPSGERNRDDWIETAVASRADILAWPILEITPDVDHAINEKFWLNLPLFLIGGPFSWFVADCNYAARATLKIRLYDLTLLQTDGTRIGDSLAEIADYQSTYRGKPLDFMDRAGGNVGYYALSVVVPPGLIARSTEDCSTALREDALEFIAADLAERIRSEPSKVLSFEPVNFFVASKGLIAQRTGEGTVEVSGRVQFRPDYRVSALRSFRLSAGEESVEFPFDAGEEASNDVWQRNYALRGSLPVAPSVDSVQVTVFHAGDERSRTYTLPVTGSGDSRD